MAANDRHQTIREVRKRFARTDPTIARWVKSGILPPPIYINGIRAWREADLAIAEERLRARPHRSFPPGREADGRDYGHVLQREEAELEQAAARALSLAGVDAVGKALARFTRSGRLADIPVNDRRDAIRELRRLAP
jgi:predicted DNA-binding transcriptional regulator AlpA